MYMRTGRISHIPNPTVVLLAILGLVAGCSGRVVECARNSECADSGVARSTSELKCPTREVYCLQGQCKGGCGESCTVLRTNLNPCSEGMCTSRLELSYCTMLPIPCETAGDCPLYLPPLADGGQSSWTCENQICRYPGFEYPTN